MLWLVVEKGLESHPQVKLILDSLQAEGYEIHFLTNNFPKLDDSSRVASPSNYPKMLNELASKNLNDVIVFAQNRVDGFNGLRRSLPGNIRWIGIPSRSQDFTLAVTSLTQDSLMVRMGHTNANETYFTNDYVSSISSPQIARAKDTIRILLFSEAKYDYDEKIIRASILTIQESFPVVIKYLKANAPGVLADWQLWLSDKPIPTSEAKNILAVIIQPANGLIIRKNYNQWEITQRLNEEVALNENLTVEMAHLLLPTRGLWKTARQMDVRMLPDSTAWPRMEVDEGQLLAGVDKMPADPYILAFMLTLLLIERIIAYQRNQ